MTEKKKGIISKIIEKLDKKLEVKAKDKGCCCQGSKDKKC
jgi:hypothetical protein